MTDRTRTLAARTLWIIGMGFAVIDVVFAISSFQITNRQYSVGDVMFTIMTAVVSVVYGTAGMLVTTRKGSVLGWIFGVVGISLALGPLSEQYVLFATVTHPGSLPGPQWVSLLTAAYGIGGASIALVLLLFPDGHPPSPRWRWVQWTLPAAVLVAIVSFQLIPGVLHGTQYDLGVRLMNPIGIEGARRYLNPIVEIASLIALICAALCIVAVILRFRRSRGEERQQMRWVAYMGWAIVMFFGLLFVTSWNSGLNNLVWLLLVLSIGLGIPIAFAIAILKYRLYDLDVVVKKTVVFALVAAFITALYVLMVIAVPTLIIGVGAGGGFSPLSLITTVVVALLFQPVRNRARRFADRIVYGSRATPYEVLSAFSERLSDAYSTDDVLPRMAELVRASSGASSVRIGVRVGAELIPAASSPAEGAVPSTIPEPSEELPPLEQAVQSYPVLHQGELLGAIALEMPANDPMTPAKRQLVQDLASQAGLVLRNVRLIEELRASRRRIVTAQDERAKKLERNIHDGAQQRLVALSVKLRLAEQLTGRDPAKAAEMLSQLQMDTTETLEELRDLARGIYPPLLADRGLSEALEAQARKSPLPVAVESDGTGRYPQELEAAVYFSCLEALQNVGKYAGASGVRVRLHDRGGNLVFEVEDDGAGFDVAATRQGSGLQGMADRLEALGGTLEIRSSPGGGTTVIGRVPANAGQTEPQPDFAASQADSSRSGPKTALGM
ncbi:MAG: histidine kinase [Actinomycetota bacterium]|nr:histidine kinase [Actinomycetota bacterium]